MKCAVLWWKYDETPPDIGLQASTLKSLGYETTVFHSPLSHGDYEEINECRFLWTAMNYLFLDDAIRKHIDIPIITKIDGYGPTSIIPDKGPRTGFENITKHADLVTCLDFNAYEEFIKSNKNFEYDKIFYLPNATAQMKTGQKKTDDFVVGSLVKERPVREPVHYLEATNIIGKNHPYVKFVFPLKQMRFDSVQYPYVAFQPLVPYSDLPDFFAECDVFTHYSSWDVFPKTITDSFSAGKAPITSDIVRTQGIRRKYLPHVKSFIGDSIDKAYGEIRKYFRSGSGYHLVVRPKRSPLACANSIEWAIKNRNQYLDMCSEAKLWSDEWYGWKEKWEITFELMEKRNLW